NLLVKTSVEEGAQPVTAAGMPEFAQRLGFDLPDTLARYREVLANFFERVFAAILQAEAHLDDLLFARAEGLEDFRGLLAQVEIDDRLRWRHDAAVHDEIAQVRFFFFADGRFERDELLRD